MPITMNIRDNMIITTTLHLSALTHRSWNSGLRSAGKELKLTRTAGSVGPLLCNSFQPANKSTNHELPMVYRNYYPGTLRCIPFTHTYSTYSHVRKKEVQIHQKYATITRTLQVSRCLIRSSPELSHYFVHFHLHLHIIFPLVPLDHQIFGFPFS